MSLHNKSLAELSRALHDADVSSLELTQDFLSRIQANTDLNAFITLCEPQALAQAKAADQLRTKGKAGVLTGIPLAHKDIFCTQGIKSSCGSKMLDNFISPYNATLIEQFNQAGCVTLGKTNMDEFAMGSSNETSYYGKVKNPWDKTRVPGGSSGGSAAAVAARLVPGATGTDTGGSIRQPAALTGITGLKPTYGRVSRYGMIAFASSLDQAGPLARSAEDCALMLQAMAGFDTKDSTSIDTPVPDYVKNLNKPLKGLKVGLPKEYFTSGLRSEIADGVHAAIDLLAKQGVKFVDISLPNQALSIPAYYVVAPAECSSNLSRYDGVRFGHRCDNPVDLEDLYKRSRGEGFGAEVKRRMMIGTYVLSAGYYDAYYLKAQQIRQLISKDFSLAFEQVDLILGPTIANTAFQFGAKSEDPIAMYMEDIYTCAANLAGLPGISVPCGLVDGMPIGLQIIGKAFAEADVLNLAHQYQSLTAWHQECPAEYV